jgi:GT2 family glycosyltransferase/glycosyltransferase involved in cell wall biosynthesis
VATPNDPLPILLLHGANAGARQPRSSDVPAAVRIETTDAAPWDALRALHRAEPAASVIVLRADARLPPNGFARLLAAARGLDADLVSPLSPDPALTPVALGAAPADADADAVDRGVALYGTRRALATAHWSSWCSLWRPKALDWLGRVVGAPPSTLPESLRGVVVDSLYVGPARAVLRGSALPADPREAPAPTPLDLLRRRFAPVATGSPALPGLDGRPVVLHVLHGWGGGVERFVRDLAAADQRHCHLALVARGHPGRRRHGEALELLLPAAPAAPPLRRFALDRPIATTALGHEAWRAALASVIGDFAVDAIVISSLIGHSLDAFSTRLPTVVVTHDYYPCWPILHADFGADPAAFAPERLPEALAAATDLPFAERDPDHWATLRTRWVECLHASGATLVSPSVTARENLRRIEPRLAAMPWHVIPHGLAPFDAPIVDARPPTRQRPVLLVPGRINGAKGRDLLDRALPRLCEFADVHLLGCGKAGEAYFGRGGVDIELDYDRGDLPRHVARIRPDLALLPSTVAETFSYTLSEMRALGVPPVATALGSFLERVEDGEDGFLAPPEPARFVEHVRAILADRGRLERVRARLAASPEPDASVMAAAWAEVLDLAPRGVPRARPRAATAGELAAVEAVELGARATSALAEAETRLDAQRRELERRATWAFELEQQLAERSAWAQRLETELRTEREERTATFAALRQLRAEFDERLRWVESLQAEIDRQTARLAEAEARHDEASRQWSDQRRGYESEIDRLGRALSELGESHQRAVGALDELEREFAERTRWALALDAQIRTIHGSWSWWLTKPVRFAGRLARTVGAGLRWRGNRLASVLGRVRRSLAMRGLAGTWRRAREEFRAPEPIAPPPPIEAPGSVAFEPFTVPGSERPRVSIVIPVYNHFDHTLVCLRSLTEHPGTIPFEVIVVDDCSSDETPERLPAIGGIRALRNPENLGFIGACNAGLAAARGEFVVFLNNDTAVRPGWLEALVGTFESRPDCGLAGAKLVYPDGRLQEAGGIVFSDASGWNYGRFGDPAHPAFNYLREVDYCSGAAIMLRRELLERFGGFDVRYRPAYYEDTDLAFRVREAGLRCYYQPAAEVVHFEGVTSGTDTGSGVKRWQVVNQGKFAERWREVLPWHPAPGTPIVVAREHRVRGRVLIVDACTPEPDKDSGSVRMVNLMRLLVADGWKVAFLPENRQHLPRYTADLQQLGVEALYLPWIADVPGWFAEHGPHLDAVILSRHYVASACLPLVEAYAPQARKIFDTVDLHYLREERAAAVAGGDPELARLAAETRRAELALVRACDLTLVVSPVEQALLAAEVPGARVEVLSNVHEVIGRRRGFAERRDLWFVGGFQHPPNVDAVRWFVAEVWPRIRAAMPEVGFHVVGSKMPEALRALAGNGVEVHGYVEDLSPFLDHCRVSVAPLRYGAGVKGKVNQAMAHGQPVVATSIAVEGMHLVDGEEVLVADTPEAFAEAVVRLHRDEVLWERLSRAGLSNVARHFSFDAARAALARVLG